MEPTSDGIEAMSYLLKCSLPTAIATCPKHSRDLPLTPLMAGSVLNKIGVRTVQIGCGDGEGHAT